MSGNFLSCSKGVKDPLEVPEALRGISPLSPPALMIPGQGDHLLSQGHPGTRWKGSWDKSYRPLEEVEGEPATCRENRPSHSSTSLGGGDFP